MAKPITTIEVISTVLGMLKTGVVALTMILLEYSKIEKAKAKLGEAKAKNDLEIEKAKNEISNDHKSDTAYVDEFLRSKMLLGHGDPNHSESDKGS